MNLVNKGTDVYKLCNDENTLLHIAIERYDMPAIKYFIEHKDNINVINHRGHTPLQVALKLRQWKTAQLLINSSADVTINSDGNESVLYLLLYNYPNDDFDFQLAKTILRAGADLNYKDLNGKTLLHKAIMGGEWDVMGNILLLGADINIKEKEYGFTPLHLAVLSNVWLVFKAIMKFHPDDIDAKDNKNQTPLMMAVNIGNYDMVETLVVLLGADVTAEDDCGYTALHLALLRDRHIHTQIVEPGLESSLQDNDGKATACKITKVDYFHVAKSRIRHGAKISLKDKYSLDRKRLAVQLLLGLRADANIKGKSEQTASHNAVLSGNLDLPGCSTEANNESLVTPLSSVICKDIILESSDAIVLLLARTKANSLVKCKSSVIDSIVHIAAKHNNCNMLKALVEGGAEFKCKNKEGQTPMDLAIRHSSVECVSMLLKWGFSFEDEKSCNNETNNRKTCEDPPI